MVLELAGLFGWLIAGLVAGYLARHVMRGGGDGNLEDIVLGTVGAVLGGLLATLLGFAATAGIWGTIVVAFLSACLVITLVQAVAPARGRLRR